MHASKIMHSVLKYACYTYRKYTFVAPADERYIHRENKNTYF